MDEGPRVEQIASWYLNDQLDFDKRLVRFRYRTIRRHLRGSRGLELGPAEGLMTQSLVSDFGDLTVVDGSEELLRHIPDHVNLTKVHSLFEAFEPVMLFDTIIMEHILEHVENPRELLSRARRWLAPGGRLIAGVPNAHSIHRLVAVKMGLLAVPEELNERDRTLGHRRVYSPSGLASEVVAIGLRIVESGGVFFKPLSNKQIEEHLNDAVIEGFYQLGEDFPDNAAEIYVVCE